MSWVRFLGRVARVVCRAACTVSWASWLRFTSVHALRVVLRVRCPGLLGCCSPVCTPCVWCCVYGVLGLLAPVHRCARSVCGVACTVSWASWLLFTGVHALCVVLRVQCPGPPGSCSPVCTLCVWCCVYGVLGLLAAVHRCARFVCGVACTVSWASWLLFTGVHALCVVLCVRCPGPPGSCSPVCTLCAWCCVYGVLGLLAPFHRCARSVCGVACTVSWASWLLFTGVHALCVVLRVRCPGPPGSCSPVCTLCVWCCVYGVLGLLAPFHRCARSVCGVACTVFWASWLLFTGVQALCVVLRVRCPGPPGSFSPVCWLCVWCCVYGVLSLLAPVLRCARSVRGVACTVSWASLLLFTGVHGLCVVLRVRRPGPPGSCSPVCTLCAWCCVYGVLGLLAPVHRCARSVCGVACTVSWASWLLFTGVHALCVVLRVRCPGPPGSFSPVCWLCVWCCVYGVLGLLAPVLRCARSVRGVACTVSWASWLLFTGVHALCVVLRVRRPGPPGSFSPVCTLCAWCCVHGVLGLLAPVHRCARSVCGVACTVSWASWLLFTGVHALCVVLRVRCPGPPGSCSPVCWLCVWCCVYGVLGLLAPFHRCARLVCGFAGTVSWASWLLFTGVHALCVVLRVRCPGPPGSFSPVYWLCVWCCVYGVLGLLAPVHRCARSVRGVACTVSWASWLLFTGVHALCVVLRVRRPGPPGSCSQVCTLCVCCCVYGVLGLLTPVHRCARSVRGVVCTVFWASWLLFTGAHALCVVLRVRCPGPPGSWSPVCTLCVWCCVHSVLGLLAPVHRCAPSVRGVACTVSWASWLLFTGVHALCVVLRVRRPGPPGSCSPVCTLCVWCCAYGVLGLLAPVHRCARSVRGVACTVSWASWLLSTGVHALCVVLRARRPGPPGSCSPVCTLCVCCCVYGVLGLLAAVHRRARSVCGVACTVSWASWLLFTGVHALCVVLRVRCPGPPGSFSPVCWLCVWCCVYGVLGLLAPVHRCARSVRGVACTVSWASWLLFTGVHPLCVVLRVRRPGPPGSCSPVCTLCVWCCVYGVLGLLAPVHRCAPSVCGVACTVSWASWLLFTSADALCVVLRVRCPGPPGSCSAVCTLCVWCCVYSVLGLLAPVHRCAPSVRGVACTVSWASWLLFTGVHALCVVLRVRRPGPPGSCSPVCTLCVWCCAYGVLGLLAPVHRCAPSVRGVACTVSWASWLLFTGVHALCVVLRVRRPGPPGSCSPVCTLCVWCCAYGVLGLLAPFHRCARSMCGVACTASWASWLLFTGVHAPCVVLRVRCPGPPGCCSPVCTLCVWCCVYGVLGLLAPAHRRARSMCGVVCTASWASWLLFTGVHALCVVLCVRCPGPPGSCSPVCTLCVWCCVYGVLGLLAPFHRCARSVCGVARTASWASWLLFTGVHALCVVLRVRCPGPPGCCSPVCTLCVWCCVYGVLGLLAPFHRCARFVCGVACTVSWVSWLLFTGVHALCVVLRVRCPGPPGSFSPVCWLCVWCCVYGVLGLLAPVHRCARSVRGVACTVSWASWLLFTGVHALCVVLRVRRPGPPGSCSPVCTLGVGCCVYGVLGLLTPVHRCARSVRGVVCTVSWASWLLFTSAHALCVVLRVRCPGPPGSFSPVCTLCVWCCVYSVLGLLAPVHRCAPSVRGVLCTVSWASWLLFTGVHALCVVLRVRRPGPPGSCSPVCTLCVWCCAYGVLGLLAPVHRGARSVRGVACTVSWASWLLFTGVHALCVVLRVRCPGPPGSFTPVCTLCLWCCVYGVLGLLAPVHRCAGFVCGVACTVSWASWLLFTGVLALCVVLRVRCPGPPGSCSPVCTLCVWCCVYRVLGLLAPVHRCARSVCGVLRVRCPGPPGSCSPVCTLCAWCCVYGVLGLLAPFHRCARSVCGVACTASWASWLLFTGVHALCVVLRVRCPGPPGCCSPVCTLCVWCCVYGVLGLLAPVHRRARSVCGVVCTVSWASRLLFTGVHALCVVLCVRRPGPPGSCSPVCTLCVWCCAYGVLGLLAPVHRCARSVRGVACTVSWASWLLFTGVHALCVVLRARRPGPPGSCSPVCWLCVWCCVYGVLGLLAPVHRCARSVCGVACTVSWASWLLFTGVHARVWCCVYGVLGLLAPVHRCARFVCGVACTVSWASWLLFTGVHALCVVLCVRCPGPPGSCSPVCTLCAWCCVYGVLGLLAPVHRCARPVCGVACTASWASWLLFTGVHALCVVLCVRRPGPPDSCSPVCTLCAWCCVYGVLGLLAPVHQCARSVCGVACTVSWASWLLFTGVHALCVVLRVQRPGPPGSCSPVCTLCAWCCVYGVLGLLAPVHRCARSVCGVACTASWASWLLFTGVHALCVVLCVYGVLGLLAPVHRCARSVRGVACTVSWASWLLFTGVHALCVVLRVRRPGPPGSCSPVCTLCVWCCVYGVLGLLAPVHRCARSVCGVACTVSWASWLLFTGVHASCGVLRVRCPGPPGSCSPVCTLCVWCCVYGVLGLLAPFHRCAGSVCGAACTVSWASWLLFTGVHPLCVVLRLRCPGPPGSCSPVCTLCVWCCLYGVLGLLAPVHRCARSVCGVVCTASWAS